MLNLLQIHTLMLIYIYIYIYEFPGNSDKIEEAAILSMMYFVELIDYYATYSLPVKLNSSTTFLRN